MNRKFLGYVATIAAAAIICATSIFATRNDFGLGRNMEIMVNLMHTLATQYVDEVNADDMMRNGAEGITRKLDPYTAFMPEEEMSDFETMTTGRYGGIGALIRQKDDYVMIAEPYQGAPADRAGLKIGDKIVAINGEAAKHFKVEDVSKRLRGEPNSTVRVTVEQLIDGKLVEHKIRRERIAIPSIPYAGYVAEGVGYIRHSDFTNSCYDDMRDAILRLQNESQLNKLILDYRNNGGGVLQSAIDILSLFVPRGTMVVETKGRTAQESRKFLTRYDPLLPTTPIIVLINSSSASAAEIVAGAIQDLDRGVLIGERSFGKGLVQATYPLGYNSFVKLTTAHYYIPSGRCIQAAKYSSDGKAEAVADSLINEFKTAAGRKVYDGGGIMPDVKVKPEYISNFAVTLYLLGIIDDFGDEYYKKHHNATINPDNFTITEADYEDFKLLVEKRDVPYKSESRAALEKLKASLKKERYDSSAEAIKAIEAELKDDKLSNLETYRKEIIESINSNIVLRFAYSVGVIRHSLDNDIVIKRGVELLADTKEYDRIRSSQDTARK